MTTDHPLTNEQAKRLFQAPISCRNMLERCYAKKSSKAMAIKVFCLQCVGYDRSEVSACPATACPLHQYRPKFSRPPKSITPLPQEQS